jgi:tetratricopeptide (TPR) repeat protein
MRFRSLAAAAVLLALTGGLAAAQDEDWEDIAIAGVDAFNRGDYEAAIERFAVALAVARGFGEIDRHLINSVLNLAVAYDALGRFDAAEVLYLEAVRLQEQAHGAADPAMAVTLGRLADLYAGRGQWGAAEPLLRRALAVREDAAGLDHPFTAMAVEQLGDLLLSQERHREAVVQYERAIEIRAGHFGPGHASLGGVLTSAAIAYRALDREREAASALEAALAIWRERQPAPAVELLRTLQQLVALYDDQARYGPAADLQGEVVRMRFAELGDRDVSVADDLDLYTVLLRKSGAVEAAAAQAALAEQVRARAAGGR